MCVFVSSNEGRKTLAFFEGGQVFALEILDERDFQGLLVFDLELDTRNLVEPGHHGGVEAPFSGDELVSPIMSLADEQRFQNAVPCDAVDQILEITEIRPGLVAVRRNLGDANHHPETLARSRGHEFVDIVTIVAHPAPTR